ncbi:MAG: Tol-Pal system beta propeller repeat protein TolB [bacterium]|nr:Tol-Pal system beta propeller repeat protein TolB [bacterium]
MHAIIIILLLSQVSPGQVPPEEVWLKLTTAGKPKRQIRLGIEDFISKEQVPESLKNQIREIKNVVEQDLIFSLHFNLVSPIEAISLDSVKSKIPDFNRWATAEVLLTGELLAKEFLFWKGKLYLLIRVYDIGLKKEIFNNSYTLSKNSRAVAHKISDDVIKFLTGEDGVSQTKIAFSMKTGRTKEIAIVDYDGFNIEQLTTIGKLCLFPDWSPKDRCIAFSSYDSENLNLYLVDIKDGKVKLLSSINGLNSTPSFSPDGKRIALTLTKDGNPEIYIMDVSGHGLKRVTNNFAIDTSPTWSPTGREIAFVSDRAGSPQIYITDIDGTDVRRLTFDGNYNTAPAWSPRGDLITYVSQLDEGGPQIFIIDISGENQVQLTSEGSNEDPHWSPDGLHIVFSSNRSGVYKLYTMRWDGGEQRVITSTDGAYSPSWSHKLERL